MKLTILDRRGGSPTKATSTGKQFVGITPNGLRHVKVRSNADDRVVTVLLELGTGGQDALRYDGLLREVSKYVRF